VIGELPVLLIVMETNPPPFQAEESAKEIPALHEPVEPPPGEGLELPLLEELLEVEVEVEAAAADEDEDEDEEALELEAELEELDALDEPGVLGLVLLETADPDVHWEVEHWHVAASEHEGEPPPPQGTWR
jgi:hypothetical protein